MTQRRRFPKPAETVDRWLLRVRRDPDGCWIWIGARWSRGYGKLTMPGTQRRVAAHRWGYEHFVGPVPEGMELDHLCRNTSCVNPEHLEPVLHIENVRRGMAGAVNGARQRAKDRCPRGHAYDDANTYYRPGRPGRNCRACGRMVAQRIRTTRKAAA